MNLSMISRSNFFNLLLGLLLDHFLDVGLFSILEGGVIGVGVAVVVVCEHFRPLILTTRRILRDI